MEVILGKDKDIDKDKDKEKDIDKDKKKDTKGNGMPIVQLCRRETFSASHRLHNAELSAEENQRLFGKCNNVHGHGHNYVLEVVVKGEVSGETGMVLNLSDLKEYIQKAVLDKLDHKHLDLDVPEFRHTVSTTENVAVFIWNSLQTSGLPPHLLHEVRLHETDKNIVIYQGEKSKSQ